MKAIKLIAQERLVRGKKVRELRRAGKLPVGLYGRKIESVSLAVPGGEFSQVYATAGETGLVELKYGDKTEHVLIKEVQIDPISRQIVHAELQAVSLTEKIKASVAVEPVGESPAVRDKIGVLLQTLNEVEVEALPQDLPEKIGVRVEALVAVDDQVQVKDLKVPAGVEVLTDGEEIVVKIGEAVAEETAKEIAAEEAKAAEHQAEGVGATPTQA